MASHLVQRGTSLKAVADLLGHVSLNTTQVYAKVNLPLLKQVAAPWPKEVRPLRTSLSLTKAIDFYLSTRRSLGFALKSNERLLRSLTRYAEKVHQGDAQVEQKILALATYLGHRNICHTYWYLSAVPELMVLAVKHLGNSRHRRENHE